jgi:hypothetical protein
MHTESFLEKLLSDCYQEDIVNIYDVASEYFRDNPEGFAETRLLAHHLVRGKLAKYADEEQTQLTITNFGRYWMTQGGYLTYLRDEHDVKEKRAIEKELHQERLLEARLKLTQYRLMGFWIALIVSALGLALSVFNLFLFLSEKK